MSRENVDEIRMSVESGEDIRHNDAVHEVFKYVGDKQKSVSALNIGVVEYTLDTPVAAFWSGRPHVCRVPARCLRDCMATGNTCSGADRGVRKKRKSSAKRHVPLKAQLCFSSPAALLAH